MRKISRNELPRRAEPFTLGRASFEKIIAVEGISYSAEMIKTFRKLEGTSNNCHRSSGAPNLPANDSALFSFRFCDVHPKDVPDCQLRQLFEVPSTLQFGPVSPPSG